MIEIAAPIVNRLGLHARAAAKLVHLASTFQSDVHLISNGADLRRFSPDPAAAAPAFGPHMIFACRQLFPRKGIRFLVEAVARLAERFPDVRLVLAGDGFERPELEALARRLGIAERTRFLGAVPNGELPRFYRAAAVSVIPSVYEAFGVAALESSAMELPVVASDIGGLKDTVHDGRTGLLVPPKDPRALANAILRVLEDRLLREALGRAGRAMVEREFDWRDVYPRWAELYETAAQARCAMV